MSDLKKARIDYLDLLRVVAISAVIAFHYLFSAIARGRTPSVEFSPVADWARYGYFGVELFFMISGFVVVTSVSSLSFKQFLTKRFLRLYPMYWISLILIFTISTFGIWGRRGPKAEIFYYNLTMFPIAFDQPWLDAAHWFMARQLQLYLAVAIIVLFRLNKSIGNIFTWWAILGSFWYLLNLDNFGIWYFNGFFALICGGAIISLIRVDGFSKMRILALIASYIWALTSRIDLIPWLDRNRAPGHSTWIIGLSVTAIYLALMATWLPRISLWKIRGATYAGALSYPIYLIHDRLGGLAIARFATPANKYFIYLTAVGLAILLAWLMLKLETFLLRSFRQRK